MVAEALVAQGRLPAGAPRFIQQLEREFGYIREMDDPAALSWAEAKRVIAASEEVAGWFREIAETAKQDSRPASPDAEDDAPAEHNMLFTIAALVRFQAHVYTGTSAIAALIIKAFGDFEPSLRANSPTGPWYGCEGVLRDLERKGLIQIDELVLHRQGKSSVYEYRVMLTDAGLVEVKEGIRRNRDADDK